MYPFNTRDGRLIVPLEHFADFTGKNNSAKSKVLIWLQYKHGDFFSARQLHDDTGVDYDYLRSRLTFWYNIRYIDRDIRVPGNRPVWSYCIAARGKHFCDNRIPSDKRNQFVNEINIWRKIKAPINKGKF